MSALQIICLVCYLLLLLFLLLLLAFFAGTETAITSVNKLLLKSKADTGDLRAKCACWFVDHFPTFLSTVLMGTNLVTVSFVTIAGIVIDKYVFGYLLPSLPDAWEETVTTILITPIVLIFGEILPKAVARQTAEAFSLRAARPLKLSHVLLKPTVAVINVMSNGVIRLLGLPEGGDTPEVPQITSEDLKAMADIATEQGIVQQESGDWLKMVLDMDSRTVDSVMTPLVDIRSLPLQATIAELETLTAESSFHFLPVYEDRVDNIVGVISLQQLLSKSRADEDDFQQLAIAPFVSRDLLFVPETMSLNALRDEFQHTAVPLAIVVDEYGGMIGLVTLRDLIQEIVGSLQTPQNQTVQTHGNSLLCDGKMTVRELEDTLDCTLEKGDFETVAGLVLKQAGRIPRVDESFVYGGLRFTVVQLEQHRISQVNVERLP